MDRTEFEEKVVEILASCLSENDVRPRAKELLALYPALPQGDDNRVRIDLLRTALEMVLVKADVLAKGMKPTAPELLTAANSYVQAPIPQGDRPELREKIAKIKGMVKDITETAIGRDKWVDIFNELDQILASPPIPQGDDEELLTPEEYNAALLKARDRWASDDNEDEHGMWKRRLFECEREEVSKAQRDLTRQEIPEAKRQERERIIELSEYMEVKRIDYGVFRKAIRSGETWQDLKGE